MTSKSGDHRLKFSEYRNQYAAAFIANIVNLAYGTTMAWLSPALNYLQSDESPLLSGAVTTTEISWIGSSLSPGAFFGILLFGYLYTNIGPHKSILILSAPLVIFWLFIIFSNEVYHLYIARVIVGQAAGIFVCGPLFAADIGEESVRGALGNLLTLCYHIGMITGFTIAKFVSYTTLPYIMIALPVICFIGFVWFPETPQHLLKHGKTEAARKSLSFYRNINSKSEQSRIEKVEVEFEKLVKLSELRNDVSSKIQLSDFRTPAAIKGISIGIFLMAVNQLSGVFIVINYASQIFKETGSSLDPNIAIIIICITQFIGTYMSTLLVDKLGRKILLLVSTTGASIGLFIIGIFCYFKSNYGIRDLPLSWIPDVTLTFIIFMSSIGITPLPYVIVTEIMPSKIRKLSSSICISSVTVFAFICLKSFPILMEYVKIYGCMWILSAGCAIGTISFIFIISETKGKVLDVLE